MYVSRFRKPFLRLLPHWPETFRTRDEFNDYRHYVESRMWSNERRPERRPFCKKVFGHGEKAWFSRFGRPRGAVGHFTALAGLVPRICPRGTLVNLTPKVPHFSVYYPSVDGGQPPITARHQARFHPFFGVVGRGQIANGDAKHGENVRTCAARMYRNLNRSLNY